MNREHRSLSILRVLFLAGLSLAVTMSCRREPSNEALTQPVVSPLRIGYQRSPAMALIMIAQERGFYGAEGVSVDLRDFTAGKFAMQAFLGGSLDVAVSGEVPVTLAALQGNDFRVIGQVVDRTVDEVRVVAHRDPRAPDAASYFHSRRRKLATSFGGGPEFYTYNFLKKYGISPDHVELISQKPEDMPAALASNSVDAIAIFDPFARIAEKQMGPQGVTFTDPSLYSELYVISVRPQALVTQRESLRRFLVALRRAEVFADQHPKEAQEIVARVTKLDQELLRGIWNHFSFHVALTSQLSEYTNAEARWAIEKGTFPKDTPIPNFSKIIDSGILQESGHTPVAAK